MALSCRRSNESLLLETENVAKQAWVRRSTTSSGRRVLASREATMGRRLHTPSLMASAAAPPELHTEEEPAGRGGSSPDSGAVEAAQWLGTPYPAMQVRRAAFAFARCMMDPDGEL